MGLINGGFKCGDNEQSRLAIGTTRGLNWSPVSFRFFRFSRTFPKSIDLNTRAFTSKTSLIMSRTERCGRAYPLFDISTIWNAKNAILDKSSSGVRNNRFRLESTFHGSIASAIEAGNFSNDFASWMLLNPWRTTLLNQLNNSIAELTAFKQSWKSSSVTPVVERLRWSFSKSITESTITGFSISV
ncbi:hypothetical protein GCK72_007183 [Caenorhabditis remanei]|uniref:Uncharacterized protein n=1 Tax=Caenorhabditis remanei TaxID=31234 RepID=A0A6A5HKV0_CAERE|nr:hypothetical protein GCK72_007183 [Caenorhabditis remanei]KAF1767224.1 hypothetical protein GCK72_007183 [Caenorhabditis remanei]